MNFTFGAPYFLLLLLALPCFIWCKPYAKPYYFPKLSWVSKQNPLLSWEPWLKMALFSLLVVALAKPFVYDARLSLDKKGRDLIVALDASGSMAQSGFDAKDLLKTKYQTTVQLSKAFIEKRFDDNMGVVTFGTFAYTASPLTYDLPSLSLLLEMTDVGIAGESTAIGDGIMQAIHTLSYGEADHKAIILITDGEHNAGEISPKAAVNKAKDLGIKIYTIGIGKKTDYDAALLETIAQQSGGKSYGASSSKELSEIYATIDTLEPSPIRSENYLNQSLLVAYPLSVALVLLLLWAYYEQRGKQ
jgi:Ca-activated chloride channel family protein